MKRINMHGPFRERLGRCRVGVTVFAEMCGKLRRRVMKLSGEALVVKVSVASAEPRRAPTSSCYRNRVPGSTRERALQFRVSTSL